MFVLLSVSDDFLSMGEEKIYDANQSLLIQISHDSTGHLTTSQVSKEQRKITLIKTFISIEQRSMLYALYNLSFFFLFSCTCDTWKS